MDTHTTLISIYQLHELLANPDIAIIDCRYSLTEPEKGRRDYRQAHIPGAIYAHLDEDLSAPVVPGESGRHPLPTIEKVTDVFSRWGIDPGVQVIAYDESGGSIAARLWWMLHWLGHEPAAVLDGGWPLWVAEGLPVRGGAEKRPRRQFYPQPHPGLVASTAEVSAYLNDPAWRIIDSRVNPRYLGETEPIDSVAGRIPGAINAPHPDVSGPDGLFLGTDILRGHFISILDGRPPENAIFYCGSGVSAAKNLLAMAHAGLDLGRLYAGSWSEWITDPERPIERG